MNDTEVSKPKDALKSGDSKKKQPQQSSRAQLVESSDKIRQNNSRANGKSANGKFEAGVENKEESKSPKDSFKTVRKVSTDFTETNQTESLDKLEENKIREIASAFFKACEDAFQAYKDEIESFFEGLDAKLKDLTEKERGTFYHEFLPWFLHSRMEFLPEEGKKFVHIGSSFRRELKTFLEQEDLEAIESNDVEKIKEYLKNCNKKSNERISKGEDGTSTYKTHLGQAITEFMKCNEKLKAYKASFKCFFEGLDLLSKLLPKSKQKELYQIYLPLFFHAHIKIKKYDKNTIDCKIGEIIVEFKTFDKVEEIKQYKKQHMKQLENYLSNHNKDEGILFQIHRKTNKFALFKATKPEQECSEQYIINGFKISRDFPRSTEKIGGKGKFKNMTQLEALEALIRKEYKNYWEGFLSKNNQEVGWMKNIKYEFQRYLDWENEKEST